jgi:hypothetical protein
VSDFEGSPISNNTNHAGDKEEHSKVATGC